MKFYGMNKTIPIIFLSLMSILSFAQFRNVFVEIAGSEAVSFDDDRHIYVKSPVKPGFNAGASYEFFLNENVFVRAKAMLSQSNLVYNTGFHSLGGSVGMKIDYTRRDIALAIYPVNVRSQNIIFSLGLENAWLLHYNISGNISGGTINPNFPPWSREINKSNTSINRYRGGVSLQIDTRDLKSDFPFDFFINVLYNFTHDLDETFRYRLKHLRVGVGVGYVLQRDGN